MTLKFVLHLEIYPVPKILCSVFKNTFHLLFKVICKRTVGPSAEFFDLKRRQ